MNPRIREHIEEVEKARKKLKEVVLHEQENCEHVEILACNPTGRYPRRICVDCGLEELGSWWSINHWTKYGFTEQAQLGNKRGRSITQVDSDKFYRHRIEGSEVPLEKLEA